ncbi:helix-turn-helix transcriptional regulator [Micromonospora sp. WMMD1102]|uniref:helix-turn-helix transcriptional regulator n=1 Tax=Micromonospora sp. WMMD1102 TaxID=3016105 RepID=UPI002414E970|nr:helix-turn-helix transcriptional regulator [Micromonospora sp. WMMD1102]MDG4791919.1 helix-turn-helix transcriptional regulator [Micromonospora sp. WMMD1102]
MSDARRMPDMAHDHALTSLYSALMSQPDRKDAFANLIKQGRQQRGWRQEDLVAASGVSRRTLTRWEGGDAERPDLDQVRAVCIALGIRPIDAAIALGLLDADEIDQPPPPPTDPRADELLDVLQDTRIPTAAKEALLTLLRQLRNQPDDGPTSEDERKAV